MHTTYEHLTAAADAVLDGAPGPFLLVDGRTWATDGTYLWDAKKGGRCYEVAGIATNGTDPRTRDAIIRTAAMGARLAAR